jgi:hypothetical protein
MTLPLRAYITVTGSKKGLQLWRNWAETAGLFDPSEHRLGPGCAAGRHLARHAHDDGAMRSGIPTASGRGEWQPVYVSRVLARIAE